MSFSVLPKPLSKQSPLPDPRSDTKGERPRLSGHDVDLQDLLLPPTTEDFRTRYFERKDALTRLGDIASQAEPTPHLAPPGPLPSRFPQPRFPDNQTEPQSEELPLRENDPDMKAALVDINKVPQREFDPDDVLTWQGLTDTKLQLMLHSANRRGGGVEPTSREQVRRALDDIPTVAACISTCHEAMTIRRSHLAQDRTAEQVEASMRSDESMQTLMLYSTIGQQTGLFDGLPDEAARRRHLTDLVRACLTPPPGGYGIQSGFDLHDLIELGASRDRWRETKSSVFNSLVGATGPNILNGAWELGNPYMGALLGILVPVVLTGTKAADRARSDQSVPAHMSLDTKTGLLRTLTKAALSSAGSLAALRCATLFAGGGLSGVAFFGGVRLAGQLATDYLAEYGGSKLESRLKPAPRWLGTIPSPSQVAMFNALREAPSTSIYSSRADALKSVAAILASLPNSLLWATQHGYASKWTPETVVLAELVRALPDLYWHAIGNDQA